MAYERVSNSSSISSSQKKHKPIVPPLIEQSTQADSQLSQKVNPYKIPIKEERDAIRARLFENWSNAIAAKVDVKTPIQAKLTIGAPGDKYEQEADKVAAQVVNQINAPVAQQKSQNLQREEMSEEDELMMKPDTSSIQREAIPEEEEELQMKPMLQLQAGVGGMAATTELESSIKQARGGGQPLADNVRQPMEQAFGADFSGVKVHTDAQANELNQSIQARAFTTGQDLFFRQGEYNPGSRGGQELIAHELTHVVQQNGGESPWKRALQRCKEAKQQVLTPSIGEKVGQVIQRTLWQWTKGNGDNGSGDYWNAEKTIGLPTPQPKFNGTYYGQEEGDENEQAGDVQEQVKPKYEYDQKHGSLHFGGTPTPNKSKWSYEAAEANALVEGEIKKYESTIVQESGDRSTVWHLVFQTKKEAGKYYKEKKTYGETKMVSVQLTYIKTDNCISYHAYPDERVQKEGLGTSRNKIP